MHTGSLLIFIDGKKVVIGSSHFVFEDEGCKVRPEYRERFEELPEEYAHLYLAIEKELTAAICIEDPLQEGATERNLQGRSPILPLRRKIWENWLC